MINPTAFWSHVNQHGPVRRFLLGECWEWTLFKDKDGYGRRHAGKRAHRTAYELTYGPVPEGKLVCHKCANPACCRPSHLYVGTHSDNVWDSIREGTFRPKRKREQLATQATYRKITPEQVREIRSLANKAYYSDIAKQFGISRGHAVSIIRRKSWNWVA